MFRRRNMLRRMRGGNMFRRVLVSAYVPFVLAPKPNAKKGFSMSQDKMYAGSPMVRKNEEGEAKAAQMPQTPYAFAQNMSKAPNAKMPTYAGAPMTNADAE